MGIRVERARAVATQTTLEKSEFGLTCFEIFIQFGVHLLPASDVLILTLIAQLEHGDFLLFLRQLAAKKLHIAQRFFEFGRTIDKGLFGAMIVLQQLVIVELQLLNHAVMFARFLQSVLSPL